MSQGLRLMLVGFFKKLFIADRLGVLVNHVFANPQQLSGIPLLIGMYCFTFQIYYDFSGYIDIARGVAKCMGFNLIQNFNRPFFSQTISEFWRRWNISLSSWFRDYVYIPLGGNKVGFLTWTGIVVVVFMLSGLWHGAGWTFVIWGLLHALFLIIYRVLRFLRLRLKHSFPVNTNIKKIIKVSITFHLVAWAFIFFRASSLKDVVYITTHIYPGKVVLLQQVTHFLKLFDQLGLGMYQFLLAVGAIILIELGDVFIHSDKSFFIILKRSRPIRWAVYYCMIFMIIFLGQFDNSDFIYFQF